LLLTLLIFPFSSIYHNGVAQKERKKEKKPNQTNKQTNKKNKNKNKTGTRWTN